MTCRRDRDPMFPVAHWTTLSLVMTSPLRSAWRGWCRPIATVGGENSVVNSYGRVSGTERAADDASGWAERCLPRGSLA